MGFPKVTSLSRSLWALLGCLFCLGGCGESGTYTLLVLTVDPEYNTESQVASEINTRVRDDVLAPLDFEGMEGSRITVIGAMTIRTFNLLQIDLSEINVIPFEIESA